MVSQAYVLYDKERRQTIKEHSKIAQLLKLSCRDTFNNYNNNYYYNNYNLKNNYNKNSKE